MSNIIFDIEHGIKIETVQKETGSSRYFLKIIGSYIFEGVTVQAKNG